MVCPNDDPSTGGQPRAKGTIGMSLGDRYNRGEGRLANLDRYLTLQGDRAGRWWLDHTGTNRTVLTRGLYVFAAWAAMQHVALFRDPAVIAFGGLALLGARGLTQSRGGLVEQMQAEAMGLPKQAPALCRLIVLGLGLLNLAIALGEGLLAIQSGHPLPLAAAGYVLLGGAMTALQFGDYIGRTNPSTPSTGHRRRA